MIEATIKPIGLSENASMKWPSVMAMTDRVTPHDGQGIVVIFLKRQDP